MADAYVLSNTDVRTLKRIAQHERGDPINHRPPVQGQSHPGRLPVVRMGTAYGTLPAAQYDGNDALIAPGKGECKLHRLRADGSGVFDQDALPTVAYNLAPFEIAHGEGLCLLRDQTLEGDDENVSAPGYLALRWRTNEGEPPVERLLYMCGSHIQTVVNDANWHQIPLQSVYNYDTSTYGIDADQYAIELKRDGVYEIFHSWHLGLSTAGGAGVARVEGAMRSGVVLPLDSTVPCSNVTLCLALNELGHHDEADASCMFWVRRTATTANWLDFVYKRLEFVNYPEIQVTSLRIRYLGELPLATIQNFDLP
jgi:hypothetical protein